MSLSYLARNRDRLGREELRAAQGKALHRFLNDQVGAFSPHYRRVWEEHGVDVSQVRTIDDLAALPFTSKKDLVSGEGKSSPARDFVLQPDPAVLARRPGTIFRALYKGKKKVREELAREYRPVLMTSTTGRSSEPVPFFYTRHDVNNLKKTGERLMDVCDSTPDYKHLNTFPFAPHLAFWQMHYAGIAYNTFTLSTGGGKTMGTAGNVMMLGKIKPDAIIGMPTFVNHMLREAVDQGIKDVDIKSIVLGGEKVPDGTKRRLRELCARLGGTEPTRIAATYGFTEAKMAFAENPTLPGINSTGYLISPELAIIEVVDPKTGEPVPDGTTGEIVFTPLDARGSVVVRYRTGDLIEGGLVHEPCEISGRRCPRLVGRISRVSDFTRLSIDKVKGTLVNFNELEYLLDDIDGIATWQVELRKRENDPLLPDILLVHATEETGASREALEDRIRERMIKGIEMSPNEIHWRPLEEMQRMQGLGKELKEKKIVDNRAEAEGDSDGENEQ